MTTAFPLRPFGEMVDWFDSRRVPVKSADRKPGPYPYYGASGIVDWVDGYLFEGLHLLVSEDGENLRSRSTPIAFLADGKYWVNNHAHVVRGRDDADTRFFGYAMSVTDIAGHVSGSAQPKLSQSSLQAVLLPTPPAAERRAIAEVLGALDDKIAANEYLAKLSDDLAAAHFRRALRDRPMQRATYADVADVAGGGTPRTSELSYWDGEVRWATPTDITALDAPYLDTTAKTISEDGLKACSSALHPEMSVLMTSRATIGSFAMAMAPTAVNQGFIVAKAKSDNGAWWLFHEMRTRVTDYISQANGATFLELPRGRFKGLELDWPAEADLAQFQALVAPLHLRAYGAMVENRKLAATRDALLPELMSGRMRVKDAETTVEGVL